MWIARNIGEIRDDPVLRLYGACLAVTHILTFLFWWRGGLDLISLLTSGEAICWPFWKDCHEARVLGPDGIYWLLRVYLVWSLISVFFFTRKNLAVWAWWIFLGLTLLKLGIVLQDFQLRLNQHYMAGAASLAFLFIPGKRHLLRVVVVLFYFWAGLLKMNAEWLSGAALYRPIWFFKGAWLPVACAYVVVLEIVLIWGLFSRRAWLFWATLSQLLVFHVFSWPVVGFYYPTLMFCLLAIYPMDRFHSRTMQNMISKPALAFLLIFSLTQLIPYRMPGDTALTGEGRFFGVHMFDALVQCEATAILKQPNGPELKRDFYRPMAPRIHCDPIVFWNRANALCRSEERGEAFTDFDLILNSRRTSMSRMVSVIHLKNYCASSPAYRVWRHNEWIRSE